MIVIAMILTCLQQFAQIIAQRDTLRILYGDTAYYSCTINRFNECSYTLKSNLPPGFYIVFKEQKNLPAYKLREFTFNKDGKKEGHTKSYTPEGNVFLSGYFTNDVPTGEWFQYEEGYLYLKKTYLHDSTFAITYFGKNGEEVTKGYYQGNMKIGKWITQVKGYYKEEKYENGQKSATWITVDSSNRTRKVFIYQAGELAEKLHYADYNRITLHQVLQNGLDKTVLYIYRRSKSLKEKRTETWKIIPDYHGPRTYDVERYCYDRDGNLKMKFIAQGGRIVEKTKFKKEK